MVDLFAASRCMKHCRVNRKIDESCCFDLYADDDGRFLLGCTMNKNMKGKLLLTTIENSHTMDYEQLCLDAPNDKRVKAVVSRDWLTELVFTLHDKDHCKICDITFESRVFSAAPIAFRLAIHSSDSSDIRDNMGPSIAPRSRAKSATGVFGDLTCFSDTSCMELTDGSGDSDDEDERSSECRRPNASQYSTVEGAASSGDLSTVFLRTRAPIWNTELRQWLHNFGGRVRSPTFRCFVVVEDGAESTVASTLTQNKVLIRHGRVSEHSFVLDFRCPVSPLVALATMCAAQASKTYVHI